MKSAVLTRLLAIALPLSLYAANPALSADCDTALLDRLKGDYVGQQTGLRNEMKVDSIDAQNCMVMSQWMLIRGEKRIPGSMKLTLSEGLLKGTWQTGNDTGQAQFALRRNGENWNGTITGWKDQPTGSWDYVKVVEGSK